MHINGPNLLTLTNFRNFRISVHDFASTTVLPTAPSNQPTASPSKQPSQSPTTPTRVPTQTPAPTAAPTAQPSGPTTAPSQVPSILPSTLPTLLPTTPTATPTFTPTQVWSGDYVTWCNQAKCTISMPSYGISEITFICTRDLIYIDKVSSCYSSCCPGQVITTDTTAHLECTSGGTCTSPTSGPC